MTFFSSEIDLYKTHLDMVIKAALFVFGITGAVVSFVLTKVSPSALAKASIWVSVVFNAGFAVIFGMSVPRSNKAYEEHKETCKALGITHLDMSPLFGVCLVLCIMCTITVFGPAGLVGGRFFSGRASESYIRLSNKCGERCRLGNSIGVWQSTGALCQMPPLTSCSSGSASRCALRGRF